jgi:hypothetical protein
MKQLEAEKLKVQITRLYLSCKCGFDHHRDEHIVHEQTMRIGKFVYTQKQLVCYGGITSGHQCSCTQFSSQIGPLEMWKMQNIVDAKVKSTQLAIQLSHAEPRMGINPTFDAQKRPKGKRHKAKSESQVPYRTRQGYKREDSVAIDKFSKPD